MIRNQRSKFSLPSKSVYLNCAYMSPMLKSVEKAGINGIKGKRSPFDISPRDFFDSGELLRKEFAKTIKAKESNRIAIIPSVSYGIANATRNIKIGLGENVIVTGGQFPSNYYPWHRLCQENRAGLHIIDAPSTVKQRGKLWNENILNAITPTTRVVAIGNVHWADGTLFDLKAIRKRTLEVGALLIIDGTQSVGALPFNINAIQPDALICAGYKWLMGPYSIGLGYYGPCFDSGNPIEENWINRLNSEDFAGLVNYEQNYQPGALRYEVGEHSNFILAPMMLEALKQVNRWNPKNIQQHCRFISKNAIKMLSKNGFWIEEQKFRASHLFGIRLPEGSDMKKIKKRIKKNNISVSYRGDALRIAPHVYNSEKDLLQLAEVLLS